MSPARDGGGPGGNGDEERHDETAEYELGEDFLSDLDDGDDEHEEVQGDSGSEDELADDDLDDEDVEGDDELDDEDDFDEDDEEFDGEDEEDELERLIAAETEEWSHVEQDEDEDDAAADPDDEGAAAEPAEREPRTAVVVAAGEGGEPKGGLLHALGWPFRRLGLRRFPLWARFSLATVLIIGSTAGATSASIMLYLDDVAARLGENKELFGKLQQDLTAVDGGEPQTIMILGSDLRPDLVKKGLATAALSDTTMLLRLDPDRTGIALFSLPRDLKVQIPGHGTDKLNAAYALGGPELTLKTIQELTKSDSLPNGLPINHVVNVDFEGFARAVNAIDCVYVDVDRRYFNKNVIGDNVEDYDEIDIEPGYQALCGFDALDYARYRHTDNDVVRAARQQDFLREARQKVPPERLFFEDRNELIEIFVKHTTSDIDNRTAMLDVLKLFVEARDAPIKEVHFEGTLGPSFVTATQREIDRAVNQFLGIQDTPGARAADASPRGDAAKAEAARQSKALRRNKAEKERKIRGQAQLTATDFGRELAKGIRRARVGLPIYYPTLLESGTDFPQEPRVYKINGTGEGSPGRGERAAYKWVLSRPALGEYYGFMATRWKDPPILREPSEEREIGGRTYKLYYAGDRLRLVAWQTERGSFWVSNTLIQSLSNREMLEIAKGMTRLRPNG